MTFCPDKSLSYLNKKGYNIVRVPRAGLAPLDLLGRDEGGMQWLGRLETLWRSARPLPQAQAPQPAVDIEGERTDDLDLNAGLSLLKGVLSVFNAGAALDAAYKHASSLEFAFTNVKSIRVAPLDIGAYLAEGGTDDHNPVISRFFMSGQAQGFVLTEVLISDQLRVTAKTGGGETLKVDVDQISATLGARAGVSVSQTSDLGLTYAGATPVTFGFKLLRIGLAGGRWIPANTKVGDEFSFTASASPPSEEALTEHELLELSEPQPA